MKDKTRKRQQRQIVDREADALDRIILILDELANKAINLAELES